MNDMEAGHKEEKDLCKWCKSPLSPGGNNQKNYSRSFLINHFIIYLADWLKHTNNVRPKVKHDQLSEDTSLNYFQVEL